jgi:hypothetical protein
VSYRQEYNEIHHQMVTKAAGRDFASPTFARENPTTAFQQSRKPLPTSPSTTRTSTPYSFAGRVLRAHVSRREEITDDDRVSITLDTFHDGRRALRILR